MFGVRNSISYGQESGSRAEQLNLFMYSFVKFHGIFFNWNFETLPVETWNGGTGIHAVIAKNVSGENSTL